MLWNRGLVCETSEHITGSNNLEWEVVSSEIRIGIICPMSIYIGSHTKTITIIMYDNIRANNTRECRAASRVLHLFAIDRAIDSMIVQ